jgi:hypothetical protein
LFRAGGSDCISMLLSEMTSYPELNKFITDDYFQNMVNITTIYKHSNINYLQKISKISSLMLLGLGVERV